MNDYQQNNPKCINVFKKTILFCCNWTIIPSKYYAYQIKNNKKEIIILNIINNF